MSSNVPMIRDEALTPMTLEGLMTQAAMLVKSGILPKGIRTAEAAAAIILTGRELGIPPMQAFRAIYIVNGKPTISTEHMAAMLLHAGIRYNIDKLDMEGCTITFKRPGMSYTHSFTQEDAVKAKLWGTNTWAQYPKDMLYNRCFSAGARKFAPDVLGKMYTPEEIDPNSVTWDAEAQAFDVTPEPAPKPEPPTAQTDQQKRDNAPPADTRRRSPKPANGDAQARWDAFCLKLATETDMTVGTVKAKLGDRAQYKTPKEARQAFLDWMNQSMQEEAAQREAANRERGNQEASDLAMAD